MELQGTVAIVTGGNGGLGQRICHAHQMMMFFLLP